MKNVLRILVAIVVVGVLAFSFIKQNHEIDALRGQLNASINERRQADSERAAVAAESKVNTPADVNTPNDKPKSKDFAANLSPAEKIKLAKEKGFLVTSEDADYSSPVRLGARTAALRNSVGATFGPLSRQLGLSPENFNKLKDILTEARQTEMDLSQTMRMNGLDPKKPEDQKTIQALRANTLADTEAQILAVLGENGYGAYRAYVSTLPQQMLVEQIRQRLAYNNMPLSDDQASKMTVQLINDHITGLPPSQPNGIIRSNNGQMNSISETGPSFAPASLIDGNAVFKLSEFLTPPQIVVVNDLQAELNKIAAPLPKIPQALKSR